jgi:Flp pilus assembly pilin Flp
MKPETCDDPLQNGRIKPILLTNTPPVQEHQMRRIRSLVTRFLGNARAIGEESGQTLVEYGLIAVLLSIAAVFVLSLVGQDMVALFTKVSTDLQNATPP